MAKSSSDILYFNGINGTTGRYLTKPSSIKQMAELVHSLPAEGDQKFNKWLKSMSSSKFAGGYFAPMPDVDTKSIAESGWGIIFAANCDKKIIEAMEPLVEHRKSEATRIKEQRFRQFSGKDGYIPGQTDRDFLKRFDAPYTGPVEPDRVPYYLLIVGDPETIPFSFQYQLDVSYAVGRISFDKVEDYANYARSVVDAETKGVRRSRKIDLIGVSNHDDPATQLSTEYLVKPLNSFMKEKFTDWDVAMSLAKDATKARFLEALSAPDGAGFLFSASHGMGFDMGDSRQESCQGALLCQDWPGPNAWNRPISEDHFLSGHDISDDANVHGLISFNFACYGAGTPRYDDYAQPDSSGQRPVIAKKAFVSGLTKRLLSHPKGGALACVGHIERAWGHSFLSGDTQANAVFRAAFHYLLNGEPIGHALGFFNDKFAATATKLTEILEQDRYLSADEQSDPAELVPLWIEHNDARSYTIVGDPFVKLGVFHESKGESQRESGIPEIVSSESHSKVESKPVKKPKKANAVKAKTEKSKSTNDLEAKETEREVVGTKPEKKSKSKVEAESSTPTTEKAFASFQTIGTMTEKEAKERFKDLTPAKKGLTKADTAFGARTTVESVLDWLNLNPNAAWRHTAHAYGYIKPGKTGSKLVDVVPTIDAPTSMDLIDKQIRITMDRLFVASYPGTGTHHVVFNFAAQNQLDSTNEQVYFNATFRVKEGQHAAEQGIPIFVGLNVGKEGLVLEGRTVNVQNQEDESLLSFLGSEVFKKGMVLASSIQPAIGQLSQSAIGIFNYIAGRSKNVGVQVFKLGLDFSSISTRPGSLAEGSYVAMQVPGDKDIDWSEWAYDTNSGKLVRKAEPSKPVDYNYVIISVSKM